MNNPLIITCPVVGAELTKDIYPHLPLTPEEIAQAAIDAVEAGASIIHLHVRDEQGKPSQRVDIFEKVSKLIKQKCNCILEYSTGGAVGTPLENRCEPLKLKPEMASLSMGTLNFGDDIFENKKSTIEYIAQKIIENEVIPDLEIFDFGMLETAIRYMKKSLIPKKYFINFVLGVPGGMGGSLKNLLFLLDHLQADQAWSVSGIGKYQLPPAVNAITIGGHVRVGIEDNIFYRKGEMAKSNSQLIKRIVRIAKEMERPVATIEETRKLIGIF